MASPINLLEMEKWQIFEESLAIIFNNWTALKLVTGEEEPEKLEELQNLTISYFKDEHLNIEVDQLEYNFYEWFLDEFDCELEDNSTMQVAKELIEIHREIFVLNNISKYEKLKEADAKKAENDSKINADVEMEIDDPNSIVPSVVAGSNKKPEPIIDEDGFELVVNKKKRR